MANVVPGSSRPHYSSVSLRQMISVISKGLVYTHENICANVVSAALTTLSVNSLAT